MSTYKRLTAEEIVKYAIDNNIPFECYSEAVLKDSMGEDFFFTGNTHVGLELKKNVWYWWTGMNFLTDPELVIFFRERYNRNNGVIMKTWKKGFEAEMIIRRNK